jgi:small subunit ribosomal protein S7
MSRRHRAERRPAAADLRYHSEEVARLIAKVMNRGKKNTAETIVYGALDFVKQQAGVEDPIEVFKAAIENVKPKLEVKSRRVGGATYQVPIEVAPDRQTTLAMNWIVAFAKARRGVGMQRALGIELMEAYKNQGNAIKKRDDTHKMAQANKAFAHYRW